jgi:hypothetical protein
VVCSVFDKPNYFFIIIFLNVRSVLLILSVLCFLKLPLNKRAPNYKQSVRKVPMLFFSTTYIIRIKLEII